MGDGSVTQSWGLLWCATLCLEMSLAGHHLWVPLRSDVLGSSPSTHPLPQIPIQESLIEFTDNSVNKLATEAFQGGHSPPPRLLAPWVARWGASSSLLAPHAAVWEALLPWGRDG